MKTIYRDRFLSDGYPNLEDMGVEYFRKRQESRDNQQVRTRITNKIQRIERLIDLSEGLRTVAVVGCGPNPWAIKVLLERGYDAVGIEPLSGSMSAAAEFLGDPCRVLQGYAESLPLPDQSQRIILMESVLEHVDSAVISLAECCRVLVPGGVLYVSTTNRYRFSLTGRNGEFRIRFYNWFPEIVKECYVFHHLHYDPRLANFTPTPAVHWFTYSDLCKLGRQVGFAQFYSRFDLIEADTPSIKSSVTRRFLLRIIKSSPWLKAIALLQFGHAIYMLKRGDR